MTTQLNLDEIRARAEAATPGPWGVGNRTTVASEMEQLGPGHTRYRYWIADLDDFNRDESDYPNPVEPAADAAFIAHARQDIPALLAEVERLRAQLDKACGSCHPCTNWADETWRRAGRKPPTVQRWDEAMAELAAATADSGWLVWSHEHGTWWGPNGSGYSSDLAHAGRYSYTAAAEACSRRSWRSDASPPEVAVLAPSAQLYGSPDLPGLMRARIARATADAVQARRMAKAAEVPA